MTVPWIESYSWSHSLLCWSKRGTIEDSSAVPDTATLRWLIIRAAMLNHHIIRRRVQDNMRPRFTLRTLLAATTVCAVAIPALLIPGGYIFFLPLLGILCLALLWFSAYRKWKADAKPLTKYTFGLLTILLIGSASAFVGLIDVAHNRFVQVRYATEQRAAALNVEAPERFRTIALDLQAKLMTLPADQRFLSGTSADLPREIRDIRPISVVANNDYIFIKMTPDGGALIAYRKDSTFPRVKCPSIVSDLYYYPY